MHTEHLNNVRLGWVVAGWFVSVAVTSVVLIVLAGLQLVDTDPITGSLWSVLAVAIGFWIGGFFTGLRVLQAPILHGISIGLTSLIFWFFLNVAADVAFGLAAWAGLTPTLTAAIMLEQMVVAVAGAWVGYRVAQRGGAELAE